MLLHPSLICHLQTIIEINSTNVYLFDFLYFIQKKEAKKKNV